MWLLACYNSIFIFIALYDLLYGMSQARLLFVYDFLHSELSSFYCQEREEINILMMGFSMQEVCPM